MQNGNIVAQYEFVNGIPTPGLEHVYLSIYYQRNSPHPPRSDSEIVVESFRYVP